MVFYFKQYLYTIAPEALFLADSEEMNTIMIVCDSRRFNQKEYYKRLCKMNLRFVRFVKARFKALHILDQALGHVFQPMDEGL